MRVIHRVPGVMDPDMRGMNVSGRCRGKTVNWLVDTGASTSLLSLDVWRSMDGDRGLEPTKCRMTTAAGKEIVVYGTVKVHVDFGSCCLPMKVTVVEMQLEAILGMHTMSKWGVNVNFKTKELEVEDKAHQPRDRSSRKTVPIRGRTECAAGAGERVSQKKWQKSQERTVKVSECCVKDSTVADAKFGGEDSKSDKLLKGTRKMACQMSGCDPRDIQEVARKAMDVTDPAYDVEGHTLGVVDFEEGGKMVHDTSDCDPRDILEVARKAMDVTDPMHDVEGHTPMMEVFWKEGERENGQKDLNDKCKCRDQKILTDVGMYQPVGLGPLGGIRTGVQFRKGIG